MFLAASARTGPIRERQAVPMIAVNRTSLRTFCSRQSDNCTLGRVGDEE